MSAESETSRPAEKPAPYYLEDYTPGLVLEGGRYVVRAEEIQEFGRRFDPQPMHVDPEAAAASPFGGLIAPGCLTFCIRNTLYNQLPVRPVLVAGLGAEKLLLPNPVRPGDTLTIRVEVVSARPSRSKPGTGIVTTRQAVVNQSDQVVLSLDAMMIVRSRA